MSLLEIVGMIIWLWFALVGLCLMNEKGYSPSQPHFMLVWGPVLLIIAMLLPPKNPPYDQ